MSSVSRINEEFKVTADDGHSLNVRGPAAAPSDMPAVLLVHGRTWSTDGVWDLRGRSTLDELWRQGIAAYSLDLRGFGATPAGETPLLKPSTAASDVADACVWLRGRHTAPLTLCGWSYGALCSQMALATSPHREKISGEGNVKGLILFASVWDSEGKYWDEDGMWKAPVPRGPNPPAECLGDFGVPGSISAALALQFAKQASSYDPQKIDWTCLREWKHDPADLVATPRCLVIHGDQDPYAVPAQQQKLFEALGSPQKTYCAVPGSDHCVHLLNNRAVWHAAVEGFIFEVAADAPLARETPEAEVMRELKSAL